MLEGFSLMCLGRVLGVRLMVTGRSPSTFVYCMDISSRAIVGIRYRCCRLVGTMQTLVFSLHCFGDTSDRIESRHEKLHSID